MSFRDRLVDAALDDVPFLYLDTSRQIGRRTVAHEFPDRDIPFVEDLGRTARRYTIEAIVLEPGYFEKRDALEEVIERGGVHILSHPYKGERKVRISGPVNISETSANGGMASFTLNLVEGGEDEEVFAIDDTAARVANAADHTLAELAAGTKLDILGAIGDVIQAAINAINDASSALRRVRGKIAAKMNMIESLTQSIADFESEISTLLNTPQILINQFAALVSNVINLIKVADSPTENAPENTIAVDFDRPNILMDSFRSLDAFEVEAEEPPDTTEQRQVEADNQAATKEMVRVSALAETCRMLADLDLESEDQSSSIRDELLASFEGIIENENTEDPLIESLQDLRTAITEHLHTVAQELPRISTYEPPATVPALVVAYALYQDADQDLDIVARNNIVHPGFIPGGTVLEVISNV
jgi:prophage DNA circulation protein